ncbi:MAG TPA: LysM domain-containing protein, partial [Planctomycetota bacterium]|nr:LysM domain-containing protein [Planctomycetota bacterium]
ARFPGSSPMRLFMLALLLLPMTACGRFAPGYITTSDGQVLPMTDENVRATTISTIVSQLDAQLGGHWRVEAAIAELPVYDASDRSTTKDWLWPVATTTITLIGDGQGEPALNEAQVTAAVVDYLNDKVEKPKKNLHVTTTRVVDAQRFAAKAAAPAADQGKFVEKPATAAPSANRRYVVQAGDTWADLSQAFYGSPQHWRHLADANQNGELTAGREIVIPPKP